MDELPLGQPCRSPEPQGEAGLSAEGPDAEVEAGRRVQGHGGAVSRHVEPLDENPPSGDRLRGLELDLR